MKRELQWMLRRLAQDESGQAIYWAAATLVMMLTMTAFGLDLGHSYYCYRQLQASTDAAAMAGASQLPNYTAAVAQATAFSSASGARNYSASLGSAAVTTKALCLTSLPGLPLCSASVTANGINVKQTVSVSTFFAGIIGIKTVSMTASASAAMRGGGPRDPYNVAIVIDTTASMASSDSNKNCSGTRISCALGGVRTLLLELSPCMLSLSSCGTATNGNVASPIDEVTLFTYPGLSNPSADYTCPGSTPTPNEYPDATNATYATLLANYQVLGAMSDYRLSDTATTLNSASELAIAAGADSLCKGLQAKGGEGTYFAGAINAAQQYLAIRAAARTNSQNVMILLSDGDASSTAKFSAATKYLYTTGAYPSANKEMCEQAVNEATIAKNAGTKIFTVGYGASTSGCNTDVSPYNNPCYTLQQIATSGETFYADLSSSCTGAQATTTLNGIFSAIGGELSLPRLIPDGTS
jgi:hypothetical protein